MGMEFKNLLIQMYIKVNIRKENFMEKENMCGQMDHLIKELSQKEQDMVKVVGNHQDKVVIFILEDIKEIKRVVMVVMFGLMVVFIKVISRMIISNLDFI